MKGKIIALLFLLCSTSLYADSDKPDIYPYNNDATYQLYPTENMFIFLKLDTTTGKIWMLQYSLDDFEKSFEIPLSTVNQNNISSPSAKQEPGRYVLYPTRNFFTFVMLDQHDGRTWQVQWDFNQENCFVKCIKCF